jgi:hypothetical protein
MQDLFQDLGLWRPAFKKDQGRLDPLTHGETVWQWALRPQMQAIPQTTTGPTVGRHLHGVETIDYILMRTRLQMEHPQPETNTRMEEDIRSNMVLRVLATEAATDSIITVHIATTASPDTMVVI